MTAAPAPTRDAIARDERFGAPNYRPLPVVVSSAEGVWVTDVEGTRYLDMLAAYSALNFGHNHPALVAAATAQLGRVSLTSRAMHNDQFGPFAEALTRLTEMDMVLPMNTGAEAVETVIKVARKWGYDVKGVAPGRARVVACEGNFHGRTTTIISFSTDETAREGFGPFTPGFETVPYGDVAALETALAHPDAVGFLVEPVQGEAGVCLPPDGYLRTVRDLCTRYNVLFIADEIQSGFGRTGYTFACEHEDVKPDIYVLGKALGGGIVPLSAVVSRRDILGVLTPGTHGSTFGGNPLACAIGREVVRLLETGEFQERSRLLGEHMLVTLRSVRLPAVAEVRGRGLWAGVELADAAGPARSYCDALLRRGVIAKDTHRTTIRLAPPLVITESELDWGLERILAVLGEGPLGG